MITISQSFLFHSVLKRKYSCETRDELRKCLQSEEPVKIQILEINHLIDLSWDYLKFGG